MGGRAGPPPPPCPFPVPTFLNSSLIDLDRLDGLDSSPWRLEFRPGTFILVAGGGTSGLSGLGGLGLTLRLPGTGLVEREGEGDLL